MAEDFSINFSTKTGFRTPNIVKNSGSLYVPNMFTTYFSTLYKNTDYTQATAKTDNKTKTNVPQNTNTTSDVTYFDYVNYYNFERIVVTRLEDIKKGSHNNIYDARGYDISGLNLSKEELLNLCIDKTTILSEEQRAIIDEHTEKMKDPGLGIRPLHEQGYTGKGVKMAIIDQPLGEHQEYSSNIAEHHNVNITDGGEDSPVGKASMHGAAVTSIAVGQTTGVAPDASVNYYSADNYTSEPKAVEIYKANLKKGIENPKLDKADIEALQEQLDIIESTGKAQTNQPYVDAINQILDANEKLPENERVSVVSISWGFNRYAAGYEELQQAIARAKEQGVFIVSTAIDEHYGFNTDGANRNPQADPNDPKSYEAGAFWKDTGSLGEPDKKLLVPMDHRTVADYEDGTSYRYEGNDGGMSWAIPWLAGIYVLAKQANPDITPEEFWKVALETSDECRNNDDNAYVGRIINPQKLIETLEK